MPISKITLGTAQLGLDYGISNVKGKLDFHYAIDMLKFSWDNGITSYDTSPSYGNSEKIIGSFLSSDFHNDLKSIVITTKLPKMKKDGRINFDKIYYVIKKNVLKSMKDLQIKRIPIYLIHHAPDILLKDGLIIDCLKQIKQEGFIEKIGISTYYPEDIDNSLNYKEIEVIQVPINIFDHRLIKTRKLKNLKKKGYTIFARSIFLQGLFFLPLSKLPKKLEIAKKPLIKLNEISKEFGTSNARLAFQFIRDIAEIDSLVIGTETIDQIAQNLKFLEEKPLNESIVKIIKEEFSDLPEKLLNPSMWYTKI